ncbi:MAG: hypothetical protein R3B57_03030 [Phycisphaerales bacterium]
MGATRTTRLATLAGTLAATAILAGLALPSGACPEGVVTSNFRGGVSPADDAHHFDLQVWEGLVCQFNSINASTTYSIQNWGQPGARMNRSVSINGALFDPSGQRLYRMSGPPRIRELIDMDGADLAATSQYSLYPQPPSGTGFVHPTNGQTSVTFGVNMYALEHAPKGIKRLALEVDAELAADVVTVSLPREPQPELVELAPNFKGRVTNFVVTDDGRVSVKFEYRIGLGDGPRPAFYAIELLDTTGAVIQTNYPPQEIVTRDAIVGVHHTQNVGLGRRELGEIRLTIVTDLIPHTFEVVEEDLPLLD